MAGNTKGRRLSAARRRYAQDPHTREAALERSRLQRERIKTDHDYAERKREWQRRHRRRKAAKALQLDNAATTTAEGGGVAGPSCDFSHRE